MTREKVYLRELLTTKEYNESAAKLRLCLGKTIGGERVIGELASMPHCLRAGSTGSGTWACSNTTLMQQG